MKTPITSAIALVCLGLAGSLAAQTIAEFPIPTANSFAYEIVAGPHGNMWFTEGDANQIGQITPAGAITEFPIPTAHSAPRGITLGPDGNLWFTERNAIGRVRHVCCDDPLSEP